MVDADGLLWLKNELEGKTQHHEGRYLGLKSEAVIDAGRYCQVKYAHYGAGSGELFGQDQDANVEPELCTPEPSYCRVAPNAAVRSERSRVPAAPS